VTLTYVQGFTLNGATLNEFKCSNCNANIRVGRVEGFDPEYTRPIAYIQGNEPNYCPYCGAEAL
jgi:DNA-directed RNA polymerase subunit RPC12/RpoP